MAFCRPITDVNSVLNTPSISQEIKEVGNNMEWKCNGSKRKIQKALLKRKKELDLEKKIKKLKRKMNTSEEVLKKQNQIDNQSWNIKKKQIMKIPSYYGISIDYISELG